MAVQVNLKTLKAKQHTRVPSFNTTQSGVILNGSAMETVTLMPLGISSAYESTNEIGLGTKILVHQDGNQKGSSSLLNLDRSIFPDGWNNSWPDHNDVFRDDGIVPNIVPTCTGHGRCSSGSDISQMEEMYPEYTVLKNHSISTVSSDSGSTCISSVLHMLDHEETFQDLNPLVEGTAIGDSFPTLDTTAFFSGECFSSCESSTSFHSEEAEKISILQSFKEGQDNIHDVSVLTKKTKFSIEQSLDDKSEKYLEQRRKNNIASRCSRLTRKQRQKEMEAKAAHLTHENDALRIKISKLEELTQMLKTELVNAVLKKK